MLLCSSSILPRSSLAALTLAALTGALTGCGAATPAATTPAHGEVEVVVPKSELTALGAKVKGEDGEMGEPLSAVGTMTAIDPESLFKALENGGSGGVLGVLRGVDLGDPTSGIGGFGLSGVGVGAGGSGIGLGGLGSIGTIGRGSGGGYGVGGGYRSDPVSGTAIDTNGRSVVEFGDTTTLGLSLEQATRALRGALQKLHLCHETKGLTVSAQAAGSMALRLVIGSDGHIQYAASAAPYSPSKDVVKCVTEALTKVYVGPPPAGSFGVIETLISLRPAPKK